MGIQIIDDPKLVEAVRDNLDRSEYRDYVNHVVNDILAGRESYLLGGAVRDPIVKFLYGTNGPTKDFDLLVDDTEQPLDVHELFKGEMDVFYTSFGTVRWRPKRGLEIDVTTFRNANPIRVGEEVEPSLELWLSTCDFNTGSIAYGFRNRVLYDFKAMEGIRQKQVDVIGGGDPPYKMMARLVLHSDKLGFDIGQRGLDLIRDQYSPSLDEHIGVYLDDKQKSEFFERVTSRLKEIAHSTH